MDFKIMNCNLTSYNSVIGKEDYSIVSKVDFTCFFFPFSAILSSRRNDSRVVWLIPRQWGTSSISRVKPNLSGWRRTSHYCVHRICYSSGGLFGCHAWHEKRGCDMLFFTYFDLQRLNQISLQFFLFQRFTTFTSVILSLFVGGSTLSKCC